MFANFGNNAKGVLCLIGALMFLTLSDSIIKWLSPKYALHEIMLFRACFAMIVVAVFVKLEGGIRTLKTRRPWHHLLRGLLLVFANMCFFLGLASLSLAETVTLFFVAPLFICILAAPILGERIGPARWLAILIGLIGVVVMLRPGLDLFNYTSLLPILAGFLYAVMQMFTRKLGMQDKAGTLTFYIQIAFILVSISIGLMVGDGQFNNQSNPTFDFLLRAWILPTRTDLFLLFLCGSIVACGAYLMSQAYRLAQASVVAPFEYTALPWALLIGYLLWGDWPDWISIVGSALIVISGLMVAYFEKQAVKPYLSAR